MPTAHLSRRTVVCFLAVGVALLAAGRANAGYGVGPDGQTFPVTASSAGFVQTPVSLDLVVYLDAEDSSSAVWVSDSPAIGAAGVPVGRNLGSCSASSLLPFGEANKWVCRVSTSQLQPGRTYYWWLSFARQDPGTPAPTDRISGPFSFSLAQAATPPPASGSGTAARREGAARAGLDEDDRRCSEAAGLDGLQRHAGRSSTRRSPSSSTAR